MTFASLLRVAAFSGARLPVLDEIRPRAAESGTKCKGIARPTDAARVLIYGVLSRSTPKTPDRERGIVRPELFTKDAASGNVVANILGGKDRSDEPRCGPFASHSISIAL